MSGDGRPTLADFHEALLRIEDEARAIAWAPLSSGAPSRLGLRKALERMDAVRAREDAYQAERLA